MSGRDEMGPGHVTVDEVSATSTTSVTDGTITGDSLTDSKMISMRERSKTDRITSSGRVKSVP